jgi:heme/copper-type cytochrome/quinol oxidase subunit 1
MAFPVLAAALLALEADRKLGAHVFDAANGGAILWQHLFWFFGHPEVYIVALPFFGIVTEILPVFSRKPLFGYKGLVFATIAIAGPVDERVGPPHVRDRGRAAAVLLVHDVLDRGALPGSSSSTG